MKYFSYLRLWIVLAILISLLISIQIPKSRMNELAFVSGIGIDKKDAKYEVSVQIYNPAVFGKQGGDQIGGYTFKASGHTIPEAFQNISRGFSHTFYIQTTKVVVLSNELVSGEGVSNTLDHLVRSLRVRSNKLFLISRDQPPDVVLSMFQPMEKLSSVSMSKMMSEVKRLQWGTLAETNAEKLMSILTMGRSDIVIPYMEMRGDVEEGLSKKNIEKFLIESRVPVQGLAVFHRDKLATWLTFNESTMLAILKNQTRSIYMTSACPRSGHFSIRTSDTHAQVIPNTDPPSIAIHVRIDANLVADDCAHQDKKEQVSLDELGSSLEETIEKDIRALFAKSKAYQTDFIGLRELMYRKHPGAWKQNPDEWMEKLLDTPVSVHVKVEIVTTGANKISRNGGLR